MYFIVRTQIDSEEILLKSKNLNYVKRTFSFLVKNKKNKEKFDFQKRDFFQKKRYGSFLSDHSIYSLDQDLN